MRPQGRCVTRVGPCGGVYQGIVDHFGARKFPYWLYECPTNQRGKRGVLGLYRIGGDAKRRGLAVVTVCP